MVGRCPKPKALDDMPPGSEPEMVVGGAIDRTPASLELVEAPPGLSMSILGDISAPPLLLCLRWRFDDTVAGRTREEAPGPGVDFGGAAAMGTTPFPPMPPADEPVLP
jgi:hypothetical protein